MKNLIKTYDKTSSIDAIKVAPFDVNKRYTKPHRHNKYLEIVYFTEGEGFHHLDSKSYKIKSPIVFVVKKEEVHNWEINTIPKGYVIIIKETFLDKTLDRYINIQLNNLKGIKKIQLPKKDTTLNPLFKILHEEMEQTLPQTEFIEGVLKALLGKIIAYNLSNKTTNDIVDKTSEFIELLTERPRNNVAFYAENLNLTPQNLNQICKKHYDKTASEIIAVEIIKEVKRLLIYTNQTISEVAFQLDFKDVSHFVKYFKRHTGITPLQFKKNQ